MPLSSSLSQLLVVKRDANQAVARVADRIVTWQQLQQDIRRVVDALCATEAGSQTYGACALYCDSAYWFAVGFFATLQTGKDLLLLPNAQQEMLSQISANTLLLSDRGDLANSAQGVDLRGCVAGSALDTCLHTRHSITFSELEQDSRISIFTSGTRSTPERIDKTLGNFAAEVGCLEQLFAARAANRLVLASVSHQHIYGALFRVLWPLCAGRVFVDELIQYPEQLAAYAAKTSLLVSSPALLKRIAHEPGLTLPALVFSSGGPLDAECNLSLVKATGCELLEVFGSTETGGVAVRQLTVSELWRLMPGVQARLADNGRMEVESGHCAGGRFVMGDRCQLLDRQHFHLLGRVDRVAKIEEKRISLNAVEACLAAEDWIASAYALVLPGKRELLALVVELNAKGRQQLEQDGSRQLKQQVRAVLSQVLERVTLPRKIRFVNCMPLTPQGKMDAVTIRGMFQS